MVHCGGGWKKYIKNVEISCFSTIRQNRAKKPLFAIISVIYFRGRLLRLLHLLLQFSTDLDNSFCILFTIGWTSYLLLRILNFCPKTKWRPLDFGISKKKNLPTFRRCHFGLRSKFKILSNKEVVHPIVKRMQKELSKSVENCRRRCKIRNGLPGLLTLTLTLTLGPQNFFCAIFGLYWVHMK